MTQTNRPPASAPQGQLGSQLKDRRVARGRTLEEISEKTRISVRHLQAIEEGSAQGLPGGIIGKSFVRQYAEALGLDGDQILTEYMLITGVDLEVPFEERKISPFTPESLRRFQTRWWKTFALIVAAITLVISIIAYRYFASGPAPSSSAPPASPSAPASALPDAGTPPPAEKFRMAPPAPGKPSTPASPAPSQAEQPDEAAPAPDPAPAPAPAEVQ